MAKKVTKKSETVRSRYAEPVKLRSKLLKDGRRSLYLEFSGKITGKRTYKFLSLYLMPGKTDDEKEQNEAVMAQANEQVKFYSHEIILDSAGIDDRSFRARMPLVDWIEKVRKERESQSNLSDKDSRWDALLQDLREYDADVQLSEIDQRWVDGFARFEEKRASRTNPDKTISRSTIRSVLAYLSIALNNAYRERLINTHPCTEVMRGYKQSESLRQFLNVDEINRLIDTPADSMWLKLSFLFAVFTGLRYGDLKKLRWCDIKKVGECEQIEIMQGKTDKMVYIPLGKMAKMCLPQRMPKAKPKDLVFQHVGGTKDVLQRWLKDAGIDREIVFHSSRHSFATLCITAGVDIYTTSSLLGHCSVEKTLIYANVINDKKSQAVGMVDKLLTSPSSGSDI